MTDFLLSSTPVLAPIMLVDLDDTLFQTHRRITPQPDFKMATTDKQGQALAYMNPVQQHFVQWLLQSTHVIPVTARSAEALSRVHLPFQYGAVCSHGGTVLNADLSINQDWHLQMQQVLLPYKARLQALMQVIQQAVDFGSIRTWIVEEQGLGLYLVAKQNTENDNPYAPNFLPELLNSLSDELLDGFYFHLNGNNLAFIPKPVSKANAAKFLLQQLDVPQRSILGFGDSLSDVEFLNLCDWWGMPNHSQLNRWVKHNLAQQYVQEGYYGDYQ
ncbi:HAD hydrolase family protein [Acinetobacter sp. ANC 4805]|uniref:HAD hydrolase family protein n=1 Tax=Acinetobacter sp. ANC 4805 TaxID=2923425 RepID=UPI001F4BBD4D|nr:HAD hydrolase family protein [Acinetobacter sp. ANC 4805]MCH7311834.1 HAD hydrolase family protein [Acinetobacter sp. ANC 4805]